MWLRRWGQSSSCRDPECKSESFWKLGGLEARLVLPGSAMLSVSATRKNQQPRNVYVLRLHTQTHSTVPQGGWSPGGCPIEHQVYYKRGKVIPGNVVPRGKVSVS